MRIPQFIISILQLLVLFFITNAAYPASFYQDSLSFGTTTSTQSKVLEFGIGATKGCFQFDYANTNMQYSNDCSTYKDFFESPLSTRGDLLTFDATGDHVVLPLGTASQVLTSDGTDVYWADTQSTYTDPMTTRGDVLVRDSGNVTARLPIGTASQILTSNGTDVLWDDLPAGYSDPLTTEGDILYRTSVATDRLAVGTASQVLTSNGTTVLWDSLPVGYSDPMTTRGDVLVRNASNLTDRLPVGTASQVLTSDGTDVLWEDVPAGFADPMTTAGDLIYRDSLNATNRLAVGTASQVLTSDGTNLLWGDTPVGFADPMTTEGDIIYRTGVATDRLAVGTASQVLTSNGTTVLWADSPSAPTTFDSSTFGIYTGSNDLLFNVGADVTLQAPATSGTIALTSQVLDTNISSPAYKDSLVYNNDTSTWENRNLTGNYLLNGDFEVDVVGWTASGDITIARNTTTPLVGSGDALITKGAADMSTDSIQAAFSIANVQKSRNVEVSFEYATSANYVDDDIEVKVYDVTNAAYVSSNPIDLKASSGNKFYAVFQAASNSTSYRLDFVIASTSALAYTVNIDNVTVRPMQNLVVDNSGKQYDLTVTGANNWSTNIAYGYVYLTKDLKWRMAFNINGNVDSGTRSTYSPAITGIVSAAQAQAISGHCLTTATVYDTRFGVSTNTITIDHSSATTTYYRFSGDVALASMPTFVSAADFPQLLDLSTRQITVIADTVTTLTANTAIVFTNKLTDLTGDYNSSTGAFVLPETGSYNFSLGMRVENAIDFSVRKNGTIYLPIGRATNTVSSQFAISTSFLVYGVKGDSITITPSANSSFASEEYLGIFKVPYNQSAIISERVSAIYQDNSGQALTDSTVITYNTKIEDSHTVYSAGTFTAKKSGRATIVGLIQTAAVSATIGNYLMASVYKNGSLYTRGMMDVCEDTTSRRFTSTFNTVMPVVLGDTITIIPTETLPAVNLFASGASNHVSIIIE